MFPYVSCLVFIIIFAIWVDLLPLDGNRKRVLYLIFVFAYLFFFSAFRNVSVGTDLVTYLKAFEVIKDIQWNELMNTNEQVWWISMEYGYLVFNKLLSIVSFNERILLIGTSIFIIIGFAIYIYKNSEIPWLSVFLLITFGYYTQSFNVLRQYMAIVVVLNCIKYVNHRQFLNFFIGIIFASFFHLTALFFVILYPLSKYRISKQYVLSLFMISVFLFFVFNIILNFIAQNIGFATYAEENLKGGGMSMFILLSFITLAGFLLLSKESREQGEMNVYFHIMLIATAFQIIGFQFGMIGRLLLYFSINIIIFIPNVLFSIDKKEIRWVGILYVCIFFALYFFTVELKNDTSKVVPYLFMWE